MRTMLRELLDAVASEDLAPLPLTAFSAEQVCSAFRYMAQAKHTGKVVITRPQGEDRALDRPRRGFDFSRLDAGATYLVTGGLGALGMAVAEGMSARGARHLALMGRTATSVQAAARISTLRAAGTRVEVVAGDVSCREDVERVLARIQRDGPPLRGVVHCAGVLDDGALVKLDVDRFAAVMAPKVVGSWHLHELTRDATLDFFVMFSSGSSLVGARGQGNYAAANAFLDGLAHHRCALGLAATSLNWGPWAGAGFASSREAVDAVTAQGMELIRPASGLRVMDVALSLGEPQVGVLPIADLPRFARQLGKAVPAFFSELVDTQEQAAAEDNDTSAEFVARLAEAPEGKRRGMLLDFVRNRARRLLGLDASQSLNPHQALSDLGLDSLMAVELGNLLGAELDCAASVPATLLFDYPTAAAVTDYLAEEVFGWSTVSDPVSPAVDNDELAAIAALSDAEAEELLLQELRLGGADHHER
jgi:acyl carrier protein